MRASANPFIPNVKEEEEGKPGTNMVDYDQFFNGKREEATMMAAFRESRKNLGHLKYMQKSTTASPSPRRVDLESLVSGRKNQKKVVEPKLSKEEDSVLESICKELIEKGNS